MIRFITQVDQHGYVDSLSVWQAGRHVGEKNQLINT